MGRRHRFCQRGRPLPTSMARLLTRSRIPRLCYTGSQRRSNCPRISVDPGSITASHADRPDRHDPAVPHGTGDATRCPLCRRPRYLCLCSRVPRVENRTAVLMLQHPRERFHPFGTARLVEQSLGRVDVQVWSHPVNSGGTGPARFAHLRVPAGAALLYPDPAAPDLSRVSRATLPAGLVLLDGTWHHARRMLRDTPALQALPRVRLEPPAPGRYRIRREPARACLSTVEALVQALAILEPQTSGLEELLGVFDSMIEEQLELSRRYRRATRWRQRRPRPRAIPAALRGTAERLIVVYGESTGPRERTRAPDRRQLLRWLAMRPATGAKFEQVVRPDHAAPDDVQLARVGLTRGELERGCALEEFRSRWEHFRRPGDVLLAWNQSSLDLLQSTGLAAEMILLKAVYCNLTQHRCGTLDQVCDAADLVPAAPRFTGRGGRRLAQAVAVLDHLRQLAAPADS
jgi:DTW domain-containing protein YfiP